MHRFALVTALLASLTSDARAGKGSRAMPQGFEWCVATAGHQIEGGNDQSDWWDWEQQPGRIAHGDRSGRASDSWERTSRDLEMLSELNATAYRFSVEWSRIEPKPGEYDPLAIEHYADLVRRLEARSIRPIITLQHFVMPRWLREKGGWVWTGSAEAFSQFAELVATRIAPHATEFVTINEPMVNILGGYFLGNVPPGEKRSLKEVVPVLTAMLRAHAAAYRTLHKIRPSAHVGFAHHLRAFEADRAWNPLDHWLAKVLDQAWNWALPDAMETGILRLSIPGLVAAKEKIEGLQGTQDFVGVNYYTRERIRSGVILRAAFGHPSAADQRRVEAMYDPSNWESYPQGLTHLLVEATRRYPGKPIRITENGVADAADTKRPDYLRSHLLAVADAIEQGAPVQGYCHWSLLDNFEWVHGFGPRFGLYEVDYQTYERKPRPSALLFSSYAATNSIQPAP